jgi:flagella basal body P-ring formation protein FlgA
MSHRKSTRAYKCGKADLLAAFLVTTCALLCQASAENETDGLEKDFDLKIYLPREVTVKDSSLSLGQVSIIRGDASLGAKAGKIALGRISVPGQKVVLERPTLLSRLACNGIDISRVKLTGAEKITVKQLYKTISGDQFVSLASSFLKANTYRNSACQWDPIRTPKDFVVSGPAKDITFSPRLAPSTVKNQAKVEIALLSGGKKIGVREVSFTLKHICHQAVAKIDIAEGQTLSQENVKIEEKLSDRPEPAGWKPPFGQVAKRRLPAKTIIRPQMAGPARAPIVVKRNQNVLIRIENPGFLITAAGTALQDGKAGEHIRVRNVDSRRVIIAKINADASVEPVL